MSQETKKCSKCGEVKPLYEFAFRGAAKVVRRGVCRECKRYAHKHWRDKNRERVREKGKETMRKLYAKNPDKFRAKSKSFYQNNKDVCQAKHREWVERNHALVLRYAKLYRIENIDSVKRCIEKWRAKSRGKIVAYNAATRDALKDSYVKRVLFNNCTYSGIDIPEEIVQEKRMQLIVFRLAKEFKRTVNEVFK